MLCSGWTLNRSVNGVNLIHLGTFVLQNKYTISVYLKYSVSHLKYWSGMQAFESPICAPKHTHSLQLTQCNVGKPWLRSKEADQSGKP